VKGSTPAGGAVAPWDGCPAERGSGTVEDITRPAPAAQETDMYAKQITTRAAAPPSQLDGVPDDWAVFPK
jgi:hypothetical protein